MNRHLCFIGISILLFHCQNPVSPDKNENNQILTGKWLLVKEVEQIGANSRSFSCAPASGNSPEASILEFTADKKISYVYPKAGDYAPDTGTYVSQRNFFITQYYNRSNQLAFTDTTNFSFSKGSLILEYQLIGTDIIAPNKKVTDTIIFRDYYVPFTGSIPQSNRAGQLQ